MMNDIPKIMGAMPVMVKIVAMAKMGFADVSCPTHMK